MFETQTFTISWYYSVVGVSYNTAIKSTRGFYPFIHGHGIVYKFTHSLILYEVLMFMYFLLTWLIDLENLGVCEKSLKFMITVFLYNYVQTYSNQVHTQNDDADADDDDDDAADALSS